MLTWQNARPDKIDVNLSGDIRLKVFRKSPSTLTVATLKLFNEFHPS